MRIEWDNGQEMLGEVHSVAVPSSLRLSFPHLYNGNDIFNLQFFHFTHLCTTVLSVSQILMPLDIHDNAMRYYNTHFTGEETEA